MPAVKKAASSYQVDEESYELEILQVYVLVAQTKTCGNLLLNQIAVSDANW